ncbi:MAG: sulfotransferase [Gemmatimonadota bacterium]|nr:sulfotransferase [Gemmatimonadota bacterium]
MFLLTASWRSGSTLLQRLIMSDPAVMLWGEPFAHCGYIERLAGSMSAFTAAWPPDFFFLGHRPEDENLEESWIANLYPEPFAVLAAHRAFFETLFARPAQAAGYRRWGFKEVRVDIDQAAYLRWLFPDARIVLVVRNPYAAWRSYRLWRNWYQRWPDDPVLTPKRFGEVWSRLAEGFATRFEEVGGAFFRYEEFTGDGRDAALQRLAGHVSVEIDAGVLEHRVRGPFHQKLEPIPAPERLRLHRAVRRVAEDLGYEPGDY